MLPRAGINAWWRKSPPGFVRNTDFARNRLPVTTVRLVVVSAVFVSSALPPLPICVPRPAFGAKDAAAICFCRIGVRRSRPSGAAITA
jgi:hypothetical protein